MISSVMPSLKYCVLRGPRREHGEPEVEDLDHALLRQEDVLRLEVAVHDAALVCGREASRDLESVLDGLTGRNRRRGQAAAQRFAFQKLHHGVDRSVVLADVVNPQDVRVGQRSDGARLRMESPEGVRASTERFRQDLDRDFAAQAGVLRPIHLAHPARSERGEDLVRPELGLCGQRHGGRLHRGISPRGTSHCPSTRRTSRPRSRSVSNRSARGGSSSARGSPGSSRARSAGSPS